MTKYQNLKNKHQINFLKKLRYIYNHDNNDITSNIYTLYNEWIENMIYCRPLYDLYTYDDKYNCKNRCEAYIANPEPYLENHLFLVTVHFRKGKFSAKDAHSPYKSERLFKLFRKAYLNICKKLLGAKFSKKRSQQPFVLAFLDVEGSRDGQPAAAFQTPHIHALLLIRPEHRKRFLEIINDEYLKRRWKYCGLDKVDFVPFTSSQMGIEDLASYVSKYARNQLCNPRHSMTFWSYPDGLDWFTAVNNRKEIQEILQS